MAGLAGYVENGMLSHEGIECACQGLIEFKERLRLLNIQNVSVFCHCFATEYQQYTRSTPADLLRYRVSLEVISGKDEAFYGYTGAMLDLSLSDGIFVDIEEPAQKSHPLLKGGLWNRKVIQLDLCGCMKIVSKIFCQEKDPESG